MDKLKPCPFCGGVRIEVYLNPNNDLAKQSKHGTGGLTMRLIDENALVAELQKKPIHDGHFIHTRDVSDAIFNAPTISPDEVRGVGEWIEAAGGNYLVCPECKYDHALYDRLGYSCEHEYCPNCGKRLRLKGAETSE